MDLDRSLLLVIDLQLVVAPGGAWEIPGIEPVIATATALVDGHRGPTIASRHRPVPDVPGSIGPFARHDDRAPLTDEASELVPGLAHLPTADKRTYSAYRCDEVRRAVARVDRVILCGVESDCCVLATVFDLLDAGVATVVVEDAVQGPDPLAHEGALRAMHRLGDLVQLRSAGDVLERSGR